MSPLRGERSYSSGPWLGMRCRFDSAGRDPHWLHMARNMVPADAQKASQYVRRPSDKFYLTTASVTSLSQHLGVFERRAGFLTVAVIDGEVWTWTVAGGWVKRLTTAQIAAGGAALSATTPVFAVTFTDKYVFTDNTNRPWMWDGTAGAGITALSNAPAKTYGAPTVHYGKVFFIKATAVADRSTLVWSEENAPNTGYEAGGFNNAWTLEQSGHGPIFSILGTNEGIYYWRQNSIGLIRGAVTPDFVAAGVHDDVAQGVGSTLGKALFYGGAIWFIDAVQRPWRIAGGALEPIWESTLQFIVAGNLGGIPGTGQDLGFYVAPYPSLDGVVASTGATGGVGCYHAQTGNCMCTLSHQITGSVGVGEIYGLVWDDTNQRFASGTLSSGNGAGAPTLVVSPPPTGAYYATTAADDPPEFYVIAHIAAGPPSILAQWAELEALLVLEPAAGAPQGTITASIGLSDELDGFFAALTAIGTVVPPAHGASVRENRQVWGIAAEVRWLPVKISAGVGWARWGIERLLAKAQPLEAFPAKA